MKIPEEWPTREMILAGNAVSPNKNVVAIFNAMFAAAPTPETTCLFPLIDAQFETVEKGITGTTLAPVKRVEMRDDGSYTVIIDHWPAPPPPAQEGEPVAMVYHHKSGAGIGGTKWKHLPHGTNLYTHLADDKLRKASERLATHIQEAFDCYSGDEDMDNVKAFLEALEGK